MSNIIDSIQISGVTYTIQGSGGGGKAIEAGRGITVTTGTTADTVSLNLAIESGTGTASIAEGNLSQAIGNFSHAEGDNTVASGKRSHAEGHNTNASGQSSHSEGANTITNNYVEHASGRFNVSSSASTSFGNSGNTLFSVGNGTADNARHNAFEIRQNGDIYISSGGTDIKLQDNLGGGGGGNPTVELTQAEYDALVTAGTVSADTYYIITDAQAGDLINYYTKTETNTLLGGKADTATTYTKTEVDNAITAATSTKQDTLVSGTNIKTINNESILGSGNIDIQGGGKAIEAGRGITVTTGATADTVSFNLPISGGTGSRSIKEGFSTVASGNDSHAEGRLSNATGTSSHAEGEATSANGKASHAEGGTSQANGDYSHAEGFYTIAKNKSEHASGEYNVSNTGSTTADKTLFSVGNGTSDNTRHNAFEIRQNGDIYITINGQDVKLQDILLQLSGTTS